MPKATVNVEIVAPVEAKEYTLVEDLPVYDGATKVIRFKATPFRKAVLKYVVKPMGIFPEWYGEIKLNGQPVWGGSAAYFVIEDEKDVTDVLKVGENELSFYASPMSQFYYSAYLYIEDSVEEVKPPEEKPFELPAWAYFLIGSVAVALLGYGAYRIVKAVKEVTPK